jgi:hypothetical protein
MYAKQHRPWLAICAQLLYHAKQLFTEDPDPDPKKIVTIIEKKNKLICFIQICFVSLYCQFNNNKLVDRRKSEHLLLWD